jgi:GH18 family chitinase
MLAFTEANLHQLDKSLDFLNIMTYDLMNRRDNVTRHHTGVQLSREGLTSYLNHGIAPSKANLGFAFYVKWFRTDPEDASRCLGRKGVGCRTMLLEDPVTGADLGRSGSFSWHDPVPPELAASFSKAMRRGRYDSHGGGHFFWDKEENRFWSWDTPDAIQRKFPLLVDELGLGGVFAWGLGEDAPDFKHLRALTEALDSSSQSVQCSTTHNQQSIPPVRWKEEL